MKAIGAVLIGATAALMAVAATTQVSAAANEAQARQAKAAKGAITISITGIRSDKGVIRACMTGNEDTFPRCRKDPASHHTVVSADGTLTLTFADVVPGRYAIALLHDENDNGKADRALGMMPKEGFGFSRDAKVRMGPPKFADAVFSYSGGDQKLAIKMRYLL